MPQYDELYVVSDLHIGGDEGFQIFQSGARLAGFIASLTGPEAERAIIEATPDAPWDSPDGGAGVDYASPPDENAKVGLVLNGDVVDFLAESPAMYLDVTGAIRKLMDMVERAPFKPVFDALRMFLRAPSRELTIVLGNHDIELALPHVQEWLLDTLAGTDAAARGRIRFATDGAGFRCDVGGSSVLCLHGEISDDWNRVNHQGLRKISHDWNYGCDEFPWEPNGGTQLVIDLMNDIKKKRPFVDLLKPEKEAMLPILYALDNNARSKALGLVGPAIRQVGAGVWQNRFLGDGTDADTEEQSSNAPKDVFAQAALTLSAATASQSSLLDEIEDEMSRGVDPSRGEAAEDDEELLSIGRVLVAAGRSLISRLISNESDEETLRQALKYILLQDRTFALDEPDEPFNWVNEHVSHRIHFVVAGHTHLERCLARNGGHYFNSGTWAALMRLRPAQIEPRNFTEVFEGLKSARSVTDLIESGLAAPKPTVVGLRKCNGSTVGELHIARFTGNGVRLEIRKETQRSVGHTFSGGAYA